MDKKLKKGISLSIKFALISCAVIVVLGLFIKLFIKPEMIDNIKNNFKSNEYDRQVKESFNLNVGKKEIKVNNTQYTALAYEIPKDVEIISSFGSKVVYSNSIYKDNKYEGIFDLNIYDGENGNVTKVREMDSKSYIDKAEINEKYIMFKDMNSKMIVKELENNKEVFNEEHIYLGKLYGEELYYIKSSESKDLSLVIFNLKEGKKVKEINVPNNEELGVPYALLKDNNYIILDFGKGICIYNIKNEKIDLFKYPNDNR